MPPLELIANDYIGLLERRFADISVTPEIESAVAKIDKKQAPPPEQPRAQASEQVEFEPYSRSNNSPLPPHDGLVGMQSEQPREESLPLSAVLASAAASQQHNRKFKSTNQEMIFLEDRSFSPPRTQDPVESTEELAKPGEEEGKESRPRTSKGGRANERRAKSRASYNFSFEGSEGAHSRHEESRPK